MIRGRTIVLLVAVALVATYGYRAASGIWTAWFFEGGRRLYRVRDYEAAAPLLERARSGLHALRATRLAAESGLERYEEQVERVGPLAADRAPLAAAIRGFLECRCVAPASRRSWEGLADAYDHLEWADREARSLRPFEPDLPPWARVGRPGRAAVGMIRSALELAPNWYTLLDDLALTFWSYGLDREAEEAIRASALSLPVFWRHPLHRRSDLPSWMLDKFAEASREALGQVPLLAPRVHLVDLGKLELLRNRYDLAEATFRAALDSRGDATDRAEVEFHLALALVGLGEEDEARTRFEIAAENPVFRPAALSELARAFERAGDLDGALLSLRRLRHEDPRNLRYCLEFARVARRIGEWPAVLEALNWARLIHPADARPQVALVETHLEMGDLQAARTFVSELERLVDAEAVEGPADDEEQIVGRVDRKEIEWLRRRIDDAAGGRR